MKVAIIGAGFTGLSAGYYLSKKEIDVTIFESSDLPGGLAGGFYEKNWEWPLEQHYHHIFTSDSIIIDLAEEIGQKVDFKTPLSSTYIGGSIYQLDSPISLLKFNKLNFIDRLRTGSVIAFLKIDPFWKSLENISSYDFIVKTMGINSWNVLWKPLFEKKYGEYAKEINAAWFWARIKKRSAGLGYPEGGFLSFAKKIEDKIKTQGNKIVYNTKVNSVGQEGDKIRIIAGKGEYLFNKVICTLPSKPFLSITKGLAKKYINKLSRLKGLGAINLVLSLNKEYLKDGSYWLNINEMSFPFLAIVEHTNFIDKKYYNNEHLIYIVNYLPVSNNYFSLSENELLNVYLPYLKRINIDFDKKQINKAWVFKTPFAQPIVGLNQSTMIPPFKTPIKNLYLANIQQVYPWDRGANYAVELGKKLLN